MVVLDSQHSIGGVWAKERLYPGLKTNNLVGSYEFSDFRMDPEKFGIKPPQHIPGSVVHEYLHQFAEHFELDHLIRFRQKVESAQLREDGSWDLTVSLLDEKGVGGTKVKLTTRKLVVATGLTSEPYIPPFQGRESFTRPILHSRDFRAREKDVEAAKQVVILGGNKSAWDACYWAATNGAHVDLVMRPSGGGPSWVWPIFFSPLKLSIQRLSTTRFTSWFDPCVWTENDSYLWIRRLLHRTWIGQRLVSLFWTVIANFVLEANNYDSHTELQKLRPWISTFWMGNSLSIHNYDTNWFDLVRKGRIHIHIADVVSLSESTVLLSTGNKLSADALVCCTGWQAVPPIQFLPEDVTDDLGLPGRDRGDSLVADRAKDEVLSEYPILQNEPQKVLPPNCKSSDMLVPLPEKNGSHPYRLYRFLVPCHKRFFNLHNIAFIGAHLAIAAIPVAQAQALWITAFLQNRITHLQPQNIDFDELQRQTARHTEYCRLRRPPQAGGSGERYPDLVFECLSYIDMLLNDLGLNRFRKPRLLDDIFGRYVPADYKGLAKEWKEQRTV